MRHAEHWLRAILITLAMVVFSVGAHAQTTIVDTELGATFNGVITTAGADVVQGRFNAAGGEDLTLTVQAASGSTLIPTVTIRDAGGTALTGGVSRVISWMGVGNLTHVFTIPAAGVYLAEIGGSSGSGGFAAHLTGSPVASTLVAVSGNIVDALTSNPITTATITANGAAFDTTDSAGDYSGQLSAGTYDFVFAAPGYASQMQTVTVIAATPINNLDAALVPDMTVSLSTSVSGDMNPNGVVMANVVVSGPASMTINSITWTKLEGAATITAGATTATVTATLGGLADYKATLIERLESPPITEAELPPNVTLPEGEFPAGIQDRLQVLGINPLAIEVAGAVVLEVSVDTNLGVYTDHAEIHAPLPWKVSTGLRDVPQNAPVLVQAKEHTSYAWTLNPPPGSTAMLQDAGTRYPYFTPDIPGLYDLVLADVPSGGTKLQVYAGTWRGVIVDQDIDGRPVPDTACTFCHNDTFAPDKFTSWAQTGHAEIFTQNLDTGTHYGPNCFSCHLVGYDPDADNGGADEAVDYQAFLASGLLNNPGDNWSTVLQQFPETARKANIQCENCHGPQDSLAHGFAGPLGEPRVSLSADVCASCHGEPLRHARFQQWQLSGHANYELALDEGSSGSCARCHTANGFLAWLPILLDDDPMTDPLANVTVTWTEDEVHPQTCATCHDPHANGTTTGVGTNATVRISGDTPPLIAGFSLTDVGRGAICMTCHNSRRGLRNDSVWDAFSTTEKARAPHGGAQADVLAGQNAYLVAVGTRGGHSTVQDACVTCHMESTPPPQALSYNQSGTNHTFEADKNICSDCHSPYLTANDVQGGVQHLIDMVEDLIAAGHYDLMETQIAAGNTIDMNGDVLITDASLISEIHLSESRGGQALSVTFTDMSVWGPYRLTDIDVLDAGMVKIGTIADFAPDVLLKSGWNLALVENDGSTGVHNPFFAQGALIAARDGLVQLLGSGPGRQLLDSTRPDNSRRQQKVFETRRELRK